ncbi:MAG: rRNA pseudouridine synthase [Clostridiales Family XIII bacterium]|jgi:23S rRNA pseudouridine2605 synthase|nr:rRNA pseudouridine synthase [Clostridiales Family XIII bacterium]
MVRLNKYIAQSGVASRRKADELIAAGSVKVDGKTVTALGFDVEEGQAVSVGGREIRPAAKKVYIALNKPKGYITTTSDEKGRPTVMELVADAGERLFPVGRLDGPTTGLLIFTNDGDFAYALTHPKHEKPKTYRARVQGALSNEKLARLRKGVDIGGYVTAPAGIEAVKQGAGAAVVDIKISEGKNRQIRKMFTAVGCRVLDLERTAIGGVYLGPLKQGHWRKLTRAEIETLRGE